jgi:hypothetical protein
MSTAEVTEETLTKEEIQTIVDRARKRDEALKRGRAVFSCAITDAGRADPVHCRVPSECARVESQWQGSTWQVTAMTAADAPSAT